jgi:menaquinone-dependent protoporphyrinogen IX oxidase
MRYQEAGLKLSMAQVVAGALKYTRYDFFQAHPAALLPEAGGVDAATSQDAE